jgi:formate dehydrogenase subunit delta
MQNLTYNLLLNTASPTKDLERLLNSLNGIGNFYSPYSEEEAINGLIEHMRTQLAPSVRQKIINHHLNGGAGMKVIVQMAIERLVETQPQTMRVI